MCTLSHFQMKSVLHYFWCLLKINIRMKEEMEKSSVDYCLIMQSLTVCLAHQMDLKRTDNGRKNKSQTVGIFSCNPSVELQVERLGRVVCLLVCNNTNWFSHWITNRGASTQQGATDIVCCCHCFVSGYDTATSPDPELAAIPLF